MATELERRLGKAIQLYCSNCCLGDAREVRECTLDWCHLHKYRRGIDRIDQNSGKNCNCKVIVRR